MWHSLMIIGHGEYWANKLVNVIPIEANKFYNKYSGISIPSK